MSERLPLLLLPAVIAAALIASCNTGYQIEHNDSAYTEELARVVSHATTGLIAPDADITVRFVNPVVGEAAVGKALLDVFAFSPRIRGTAVFRDNRTLVFSPDRPLPLRAEYTGALRLERLAEIADAPELRALDDLVFSVITAGREVVGLEGKLETDPADASVLSYEGRVAFTLPPESDALDRAVAITLDGQRLSYDVRAGRGENEFVVRTERFVRPDVPSDLEFRLTAGALDLQNDIVESITVRPVDDFALSRVHRVIDGESTAIRVEFSDDLDPSQNLEGLVSVTGVARTDLQPLGNAVLVHGDFKHGDTYTVQVARGVKSRYGARTVTQAQRTVDMEDMAPGIEFLSSGVFLPSTGERRIHFRTVNVRRVNVEVVQVFENNLGQFLQTERLSSATDRNQQFNSQYINRVGVPVANQVLEIGAEKNRWLLHELDLRPLIDPTDQGLYIVSLTFERDAMLYDDLTENPQYYYGDEYYSNPNSWGYIQANGRAYKPVVLSDVGLTWMAGPEEHTVFATDILSASPLRGVQVQLRTYQNQLIAEGYTDNEGRVRFPEVDQSVFYIAGVHGGTRSVIKANEMSWNMSSFDVGGTSPGEGGTRAFIYTERGVYRPGDDIHLAAIFRNQHGEFPDGHPVELELTNPRGQTTYSTTNSDAKDGLYYFPLATAESDPTGTWRAELTAGPATFSHQIRVETIVPNRLRVDVVADPSEVGPDNRTVDLTLTSSYLFGAPAANLEAELEAVLEHRDKTFSNYPGYTFVNRSIEQSARNERIFDGTLNAGGVAELTYRIPQTGNPSSALDLRLDARVLEPGGRATVGSTVVPVDPYATYVGVEVPEFRWGYAQIGSELRVPAVLVDNNGTSVSGRELTYRIYRNERYWWWEYESYGAFRARYKSDSNTELISEGRVTSRSGPVAVSFEPDGWGEYLLEVQDPRSGHSAGFFFRASSWATQSVGDAEGILGVQTNRDSYNPGDTAVVTAVTPPEGSLLVAVERDGKLISSRWQRTNEGETRISIPITEEMIPTAYVTVSLLQPHAQTANDRPLRMYGVVPLNVEDPSTRRELEIIMPDELEPKEPFSVTVQTAARQETQLTVAVVDEGLLDLTAFKTPDPWNSFYAKQQLRLAAYDMFGHVLGAFAGDVFRVFSIGGGDFAGAAQPGEDETNRRFEPVALFSGPVTTDSRGRATVDFTMPNYLGSVRVMVVAADGTSYGNAEKAVPVRSDVVALPTLPRVLGPQEDFLVPVTLFALAPDLGPISVTVDTEGPVAVSGPRRRSIRLTEGRDGEVSFNLVTEPAVGPAVVRFTVEAGDEQTVLTTNIQVRASSPPLYTSTRETLEPGDGAMIRVPDGGIPGSNAATLTISAGAELKLDTRLRFLIRYPYGCIEQTTSAVFPQLFLRDFVENTRGVESVDGNIAAAIERLRSFQVASGGFAYWPGGSSASTWGTNYAGHFLIEAKNLGYSVPDDLLAEWIRFQSSAALTTRDNMMERVYRLYLLSLVDQPAVGGMNLIRESSLRELRNVERWLLAAAYERAGMSRAAEEVLGNAGTDVEEYQEFGGTYGSSLRDRAMILEAALELDRMDVADELYYQLAERMSSNDWYSTQTTGYSLLAVGKYLRKVTTDRGDRLVGTVTMPDGSEESFSTTDRVVSFGLTETAYAEGRRNPTVEIELSASSSVSRAFATMEWEGLPARPEVDAVSRNVALQTRYYDEDGRSLNPRRITQGEQFWLRLTVSRSSDLRQTMEEMALTQVLPSGWEIVNTRLIGTGRPNWMSRYNLGNEEYVDFRDDRANWFFDLPRYAGSYDFVVKLQAVTVGSFALPPTTVEAMYRREEYRAVVPGFDVVVLSRR